jgi:peptide/nickel transport system substrate-binding protein
MLAGHRQETDMKGAVTASSLGLLASLAFAAAPDSLPPSPNVSSPGPSSGLSSSASPSTRHDGFPDGGRLSYGEYGRPSTFDPVTSNDMVGLRLSELLFNGLVSFSPRNEVVPDLAQRWEVSPDQRVYKFELRGDATWHGADQLVASDDVVSTLDVIRNPRTLTPLKAPYEVVEEARAVDPHTVEIVLKRPVSNGLGRLSFKIVPISKLQNPDFLSRDDPFAQAPTGSGPFQFARVGPEGDVMMRANPTYYKGRPHLDEIVMKPFADKNVLTQSLLFRAIDMVVEVNPRDLAQIEGDQRFNLYPYNALSYTFFGHNQRNPHLAKKEVRQAIGYAINRQEMLDSFYAGRGTLISGPFAPGSWAYNLDVKPLPYDPSRARQLLEQAGYRERGPDGYLRTPSGAPLHFKLKIPIEKENETVKRVVLAFQNYLKQVGIRIDLEFREWQAWKQDVFVDHDFDIVIASWAFDDSADISTLFHSKETEPWRNNFVAYSNPSVDALIMEAKNTLDREKQRTINQRLHAVLADEQPYTFLWTVTNFAAVHRRVRHVELQPFKFFTYADTWYIPPAEQ